MKNTECPECGGDAARDAAPCPGCGHAARNGSSCRPVPAELAGWTRYETPPDVLERARREFDEEEYLAEVREVERAGGFRLEDFIDEIERIANGST